MSGFRFDPHILREYDIRGVVPPTPGATLTEEAAYHVGRAFATIARRRGAETLCVGYDGRISSPMLEAAVVDGIVETGAHAVRVGLGPTPMLYFAVQHLGADGGIMVTGSHNPPDNNGFKMVLQWASFFGADIKNLGAHAASGDYESGTGRAEEHEIAPEYVARLARDVLDAPWGSALGPVAWDAGNGAAGAVMRALTAVLPGTHELLFDEIDGTFPNHHPDPTIESNLADLKRVVGEKGCAIGVAFDGDGDRIGIVDDLGAVLWGDQILLLLADELLEERPGATVIADVKASQVLFDEVARAGGKPLMWKTGHSLVKAKMKETGAPLGGEMSGHVFIGDRYYGFDDGLYVAVRFLGLLSRAGQPLSEVRKRIPETYSTPEVRFPCPDDRKFAVIEEVRAALAREDGIDVTAIDGVRVRVGAGWWLLRASNTQPSLVVRCEGPTPEALAELKNIVRRHLAACDVAAPQGF